MLPSSHNSPRISKSETESISLQFEPYPADEASFTSTAAFAGSPSTETAAGAHALADAFASFVATSTRLEGAYRELQGEVSGLREELAERNSALKASLAENERVRKALQEIVDSMPCGVLVVSVEGKLTTINPEASRLLELGIEPALLSEIETRLGLQSRLTRLAEQGGDAEEEFPWHSAAGERWLHVIVRQIVSSKNDTAHGFTIFMVRDITAQKREENYREAARNATVLAEITTMLAHEIRNPLASLELFANLIEQDDAGRDEWIANLRAGIRTLSGTVNNVLSLHDSGRIEVFPLNFATVVESAVCFSRPLADQAGVCLIWAGTSSTFRVLASQSALQQVLLNLIRNAIRHTNTGGSITLTVEAQGNDQVLLHCTDTGSGIPVGLLSQIFQPGFSGSGDSPGLGLAVCQRILKQHNGTISVANIPGAGACFTLTLPTVSNVSNLSNLSILPRLSKLQEEVLAA